jgi:hypothetical protein
MSAKGGRGLTICKSAGDTVKASPTSAELDWKGEGSTGWSGWSEGPAWPMNWSGIATYSASLIWVLRGMVTSIFLVFSLKACTLAAVWVVGRGELLCFTTGDRILDIEGVEGCPFVGVKALESASES